MSLCTLNIQSTRLKRPLIKNTKIVFMTDYRLMQIKNNCRMLQGEHSAILSNFIKLSYLIKTFVLYICEWPLKTAFTVTIFIPRWSSIILGTSFFLINLKERILQDWRIKTKVNMIRKYHTHRSIINHCTDTEAVRGSRIPK